MRGIARSDIAHMIMCSYSGISEMKSQNVSCADAACGYPLSGFHLDRVDQIGKLHRILDEEHRDVVSDQIEVALLGIELHRKAAHVARQVNRAGPAGNRREPREHGCLVFGSRCRNAALVTWFIDL